MTERWLPIPGYEGHYEVSDQGRVKSFKRGGERIMRDAAKYAGYRTVCLTLDHGRRTHQVHSLVLRAFVGAPPARYVGCHNNGDPADNRLENLRWDTQASNVADTLAHGKHNMASKTHCPSGHPYDESNVYHRGNRRVCRTCARAASLARYYRVKERAA